MQSSTKSCIFPGHNGNIQGWYWLLNMCSSLCINNLKFTPIPDPPHINARVHELADKDNKKSDLELYDQNGNPINNDLLNYPVTIYEKTNILRSGWNRLQLLRSGTNWLWKTQLWNCRSVTKKKQQNYRSGWKQRHQSYRYEWSIIGHYPQQQNPSSGSWNVWEQHQGRTY